MADAKISQLPVATTASPTDQLEVNQTGTSRSLTLAQLQALYSGGGSGAFAPLNSPTFTGDPKAPSPAPGDDDKSIPTTEWVNDTVAAAIGGVDLSTLATKTGTLTPGNVAILTTTGIQDSGVQLISSLPATTVWGNNAAAAAPPAALTKLTMGIGTAAAPTYSFNASAGTGLYSPTTDQAAIALGGNRFISMRSSDATSYWEFLYSSGGLVRMQGAANIEMKLAGNGTGGVQLQHNAGTGNAVLFRAIGPVTAGVNNNYLKVAVGEGTGNGPIIGAVAQGTADANINIDMQPLGTGSVRNVSTFFYSRANVTIAAGSAAQAFVKGSNTADLGIYYGTGAPSFAAAKASLYVQTDATTTTTRLYVNTTGSTTWANFTASA